MLFQATDSIDNKTLCFTKAGVNQQIYNKATKICSLLYVSA